jgi:hypothetical protein
LLSLGVFARPDRVGENERGNGEADQEDQKGEDGIVSAEIEFLVHRAASGDIVIFFTKPVSIIDNSAGGGKLLRF